MPWGCFGTAISGADGAAVGTGAQNTADIVAGCNAAGIATKIADDYSLNGFNDWFLPSKDELNLMHINIGQGAAAPFTNVGGFANDYYWSSTENDANNAWNQNINNGNQNINNKNNTLRVRAVRGFKQNQ